MASKDINDADQWEQFCRELIKKTQSGTVVWQEWDHKIDRDEAKSPLLVAVYKQWKILVYKYAYKNFDEDDRFFWEEDVAIELINDTGKTEWRFPAVPSRLDLLDNIQFKHADAKGLLEDMLAQDI